MGLQIRDDIDAVMGYALSSRLLAAMCCCRLEPTPWLDEVRPCKALRAVRTHLVVLIEICVRCNAVVIEHGSLLGQALQQMYMCRCTEHKCAGLLMRCNL